MGHQQTLRRVRARSVPPSTTDMRRLRRRVRLVPEAAIHLNDEPAFSEAMECGDRKTSAACPGLPDMVVRSE
jgi:hypothetical protein